MLKCLGVGGILALVLMQSVVASPEPSITVKSAIAANTKSGAKVFAGNAITTGKAGTVTGDFNWGGVRSLTILPSSSMELTTWGNKSGGARFTELYVTGEVLIEVQTVNPATEVKVCFKNRWGKTGCSKLASSVRIAPTPSGAAVVGVQEGNISVQDKDENTPPVRVTSGQYSILGKDGSFSPARSAWEGGGYRLGQGRSKVIGVFIAEDGWRFCNGETTFRAAVGTRLCLLSPLDPSP